ncbi:MAG: ribonuclease III [Planctomycetota bacterium]|jgi:ribonuclease-3
MTDEEPAAEQPVVDLSVLEERLAYTFKKPELAIQAITHSSARDRDRPCNERLEFFGDAILGHIVSEHLFHNFPDYEEGELSTMKSIVVSAKTLSTRARDLGLDEMIILGRGLAEKRHLPRSILCNTFEALIAALYLDGGVEIARDFVLKNIRAKIEEILKNQHEKNYKSMLQDFAQRNLSTIPEYEVTKEVGPDHKKLFQVVVHLDKNSYGPAWGSNKKEAEQRAARSALAKLGLLEMVDNASAENDV